MKVAVTLLVFCVAALLGLGLVMLYSSSMVMTGARLMVMQSIWCVLGVCCAIVAASMDYGWLRKLALPLFIAAIVLLALVLDPHLGTMTKGARRWFSFGSVRFQPSEFAKLALIITLAWYCERHQRQMGTWQKGVLVPGCFIAVVLGLIYVEPDRGSTILLAAVSGAMLLIAGVQWRYFVPPVLLGAVAMAFSIWRDPVRAGRLMAWMHPEESKSGVGYQAYQGLLALGSGGWTGLGLGNSRQKHGFVPEHHTDFIYSIIGEELGLVATLLIILAFLIIVCCGVYISMRAGDLFGVLLGSGITFLIGLQAAINIGVVTSALPNKGLPLPFISYGGSNLLLMLTCVGLLLSIASHARPVESLDRTLLDPSPEPQWT